MHTLTRENVERIKLQIVHFDKVQFSAVYKQILAYQQNVENVCFKFIITIALEKKRRNYSYC